MWCFFPTLKLKKREDMQLRSKACINFEDAGVVWTDLNYSICAALTAAMHAGSDKSSTVSIDSSETFILLCPLLSLHLKF